MKTYSNLVIKQQMAAERMTPIIKAMMTSGHEIDLESGSIISGKIEYVHLKKKKKKMILWMLVLQQYF